MLILTLHDKVKALKVGLFYFTKQGQHLLIPSHSILFSVSRGYVSYLRKKYLSKQKYKCNIKKYVLLDVSMTVAIVVIANINF